MRNLGFPTVLTKKCHKPQPEHIKGGDESRNQTNQPEDPTCLVRPPQNFVLAEEAGEWGNPCDGDGGDGHGRECPGNLFSQTTHFAHVLFAANCVNHGASCQEQQALEKRVRHQVKNARRKRRHAAGQEHISKLRNRGIGENFLYVGLRNANGCSEECGKRANDRDHCESAWRTLKDQMRTRDHVHASGHHGRGVYQG